MRKHLFLAATLLVATPVALLVPGCGGGDSSVVTPQNYSSNLTLSASQTAQLALKVTGNNVQGTIAVSDVPIALAQGRSKRDVSFTIPVGTYSYSGTLTPPSTFTVSGTFPAPVGAFTITGQIPAGGGNGNYTLTANGQTASGTFSTTTPTSTATTTATATTAATATTQPNSTATPRATATTRPTSRPTTRPTTAPTTKPTIRPTTKPTTRPTTRPTAIPTGFPIGTPIPTPGPPTF